MIDKQWFIDTFDRLVSEHPDEGMTVEKARDAMSHAYLDAIERGEQRYQDSLMDEGRALFDRFVGPARDGRRRTFKNCTLFLIDALSDSTLLGVEDPVLDQAFPLGDGTDKTLRYWTSDDWAASVTERYRNAASATAAAAEFDVRAQTIITALRTTGSRQTGDLYPEQ